MSSTAQTVNYLESVATSQFTGEVLTDITGRLGHVRDKMRDPKLYLALVGEFSSGKSTFINALIGFRLLKEAVMPTTACATYIQGGGKLLTINVSFFNGRHFIATSDSWQVLAQYVSRAFGLLCASIGEVIEALTSDQMVACKVKSLHLTIPTAKIPGHIVLIDTPGFNPGADAVRNHYEITRHVVEHVADAALILTPQEQAMSASLSRFLNETLRRCLHRCLFVVTKMDNLPAEERQCVVNYALQRIKLDLNVSSPRLYAESAITMLPVRQIPIGREDDWKRFQREFKRFETEIWNNLQVRKDIVLAEHINTLVGEVTALCMQGIAEKQKAAKADRAFLETHRVSNIRTVCGEMVARSSRAIDTALSSLSVSFREVEAKCKRRAAEVIDKDAMSMDEFKNKKIPAIRRIVEDETRIVLADFDRRLNWETQRCVANEIKRMQKVFASHYDSFPALRPSEPTPQTDLVRFNTPDMKFDFALSKVEKLDSKENNIIGGGAVGGAGLGFLVGGPLGAAVGAFIGGIVGAAAGDKSDQMRASVKPLVDNEISWFYASLRMKVDDEIGNLKQRYAKLIHDFADEHVRQYGRAVDKLVRQHQAETNKLDAQIKSLRNIVATLGDIRDTIEQELAMLKLKN